METKIHIIGAGVSGLVAAKILEQHGYAPIILEASDRVGGRLKTDIIDGFQLDHGFQVLLSSYPEAKKHLDFKKLNLQEFKSGSKIFVNGQVKTIGDPTRDWTVLFSTLFSGIGTFSDKLKVNKLKKTLEGKTIEQIFHGQEQRTIDYLRELGFSSDMIEKFFVPFFSGIFLETELKTSSRMFEFIFKMFGEGFATLPKGGIEEIPKQLLTSLSKTEIKYNSPVKSLFGSEIKLVNGESIQTDYTIVATEASHIINNMSDQEIEWKHCDTLYFVSNEKIFSEPYIGLVANSGSLINNIFYHTSLQTESSGKGELLSVTIVNGHDLSEDDLIRQVDKELSELCGINNLRFLKRYQIKKALPNITDIVSDVEPSHTMLANQIFLAGDIQLNGSLNAAMRSGERAAQGLIEVLKR